MIRRPLMLTGLLGAAAGGPYLASQAPDEWPPLWNASAEAPQAEAPDPLTNPQFRPPDATSPRGPGSPAYHSLAELEGPRGLSLEQAIDWGITKNWVYQHWARKSTGLADPTLFGVRVPLVTGSGMSDLAGSLSYYFDNAGVLQRIRFNGQTADTTRVAQLAVGRFGMQPRLSPSPGDQLFQAVEAGRVRGQLRTRPDGVLWSTSPHQSFAVELEMNRPGGSRWVEPERLRFDPPPAVAATAPAEGTTAAAVDQTGQPILPPRGLVPDRPASVPATTVSTGSGAPAAASTPSVPKPPAVGAPTAAPAPQTAPLDGYRDRFRWPG